ncbi:helix-turn-helix transcriptional regulator [Labrys sp. 22185]|uniref:helix-turn-helix transcriptional regulator n=1 Tax=Labrys sp. 22185 TaxID=3453888 RepID=UPI003F839CD8
MNKSSIPGRHREVSECGPGVYVGDKPENSVNENEIPEIVVFCKYNLLRGILVRLLTASGVSPVIRGYESKDELIVDSHDNNSVVLVCDFGSDGVPSSLERNMEIINDSVSSPKMIVISDAGEHSYISRAFELGAKGFIGPGTSVDIALAAINLVWAGGEFLPAHSLSQPFGGRATAGKKTLARNGLSPREVEIVDYLRAGHRNKEISYILNIKESTVAVHIRNIIQKLNVENRMDLIRAS